MKKLVLNEWESKELKKDGAVEIVRDGFYILVEQEKYYLNGDYIITIINPYNKVVVKEVDDKKEKEK